MSILSDTEIRKEIAKGGLILEGSPERAEQCSYSFLPGRVFHPGKTDAPIDFPGLTGDVETFVGPGEMVWIRTLERVDMPGSLAGFWWQTNTLSRKGLMLVNMSMVEPGYKGPLACLFVNFGKSRVPIRPTTVIAKMVFSTIKGNVAKELDVELTTPKYDEILRDLTIEHPSTFLQVADLVTRLHDERIKILEDVKDAGIAVKTSAKDEFSVLKANALEEFKSDLPKSAWKTFGWAAAGFVVLTAAITVADLLKGNLLPDVETTARSEAQKVLNERVFVSGAPDSASSARMQQKVVELERRIAELRSQFDESGANGRQADDPRSNELRDAQ